MAEPAKVFVARYALQFVQGNSIIGLGSGSTAHEFVRQLAAEPDAETLLCVATSSETESLAAELGLNLMDPAHLEQVDLTVDGADEAGMSRSMLDFAESGGSSCGVYYAV